MNLESVQSLPSLFNKAVGSASLLALLGFSLAHSGSIGEALSSRLGTIHEVAVSGVKVTFDANDIQKNAPRLPIKELASKQVADDINKLDARALVRLMYVGTFPTLCLFDKAKAQMIDEVATDHRLQEIGLVDLDVSDALREKVAAKPDLDPALGHPVKCYEMKLTIRGQDAKTVITHMLATAFSGAPADFAPPATLDRTVVPQTKTPAPGPSAKMSKPQKVAALRR